MLHLKAVVHKFISHLIKLKAMSSKEQKLKPMSKHLMRLLKAVDLLLIPHITTKKNPQSTNNTNRTTTSSLKLSPSGRQSLIPSGTTC